MTIARLRGKTALSGDDGGLSKEPRLGNFMFLCLSAIEHLGNASGLSISDFLRQEAQIGHDTAQIYGTLQRLLDQKLVDRTGKADSGGGPPLKLYEISDLGRELLVEKARHIHALAGFDNRLQAYRTQRTVKEHRNGRHVEASLGDNKGR